MDHQSISMTDATDLIRRRWPIAATIFLAVCLAAVVIAASLENVYKSTGRIKIQAPAFGPFAGQEATDAWREALIYRIEDLATQRQILIEAIEKYDLYTEDRIDGSPGSVVPLLRENFQLEIKREETTANSRMPGRVVGFSTTFYHDRPRTAKDVAEFLQTRFISAKNELIRADQNRGSDAIVAEREELQQRLRDIEAEIEVFETTNREGLPDIEGRNRTQYERKNDELERIDQQIRTLEMQRTMLISRRALTPPTIPGAGPPGTPADVQMRLEALQSEYIQLISIYEDDHPDVARVRRQIESLMGSESAIVVRSMLEQELANETETLDELRSIYSEDHPDVRAAERRIEGLRRQLAELPADMAQQIEPTNPEYIAIEIELAAANRELQAQRALRSKTAREIEDLVVRLEGSPEVKREWHALQREKKIVENQFTALRERELAVEISGEFQALHEEWSREYPRANYQPAFPNRPLYLVLGAFIGLTLGIAASLIVEAFDGTIRGTRDIKHVMQMPPIAAIPMIKTESDLRRDRIRHITMTAAVLMTIGAVGLYVRLQQIGSI